MHATWFDVMTAAAFVAFRNHGVEWAVVEVGIGGRIDSTNVIRSDIAVITNIGLEHTDLLGDTREKIAFEKAGIIKPGADVVTQVQQEDPAGLVIQQAAARVARSIVVASAPPSATISVRNVVLAREVLRRLGARGHVSPITRTPLAAEHLPKEIAEAVSLPGRLERRVVAAPNGGGAIEVVIDGGHVAFAIEETLKELLAVGSREEQPVVVIALAADKDAKAIVGVLAPRTCLLVCTTVASKKAFWSAEALRTLASAAGAECIAIANAEAALRAAMKAASGTWVLVTGSLHLAGEILAALESQARPVDCDTRS
jgi:dihydrofolate synthase/folylpolyglutamate synthase